VNAPGLSPAEPSSSQPIAAFAARSGGDELARLNGQVKTFVAERPLLAVLMALGAGYVVGRIISRAS